MRLHAWRTGERGGTPLLFIHGVTDHGDAWGPTLAHMQSAADRIAVDLRGHGQSPSPPPIATDVAIADGYSLQDHVEDLRDTSAALGLNDIVVVGHSMGGVIGAAFAHQEPHRVRALILVGSTCRPSESLELERLQRDLLQTKVRSAIEMHGHRYPDDLLDLSMQTLDPKFSRWIDEEWCADPRALPSWRATAAEAARKLPLRTWFGAMAAFVAMDTTAELGELAIPILCIHGGDDEMFPPDHHLAAIDAAALRSRPDMKVIPGCGHNVLWHAPHQLAAAIDAFVEAL